jgi:hypothetical protein
VSNPFNRLDEPTRRAFMANMAKAAFGLSIVPVLGQGLLTALSGPCDFEPGLGSKVSIWLMPPPMYR